MLLELAVLLLEISADAPWNVLDEAFDEVLSPIYRRLLVITRILLERIEVSQQILTQDNCRFRFFPTYLLSRLAVVFSINRFINLVKAATTCENKRSKIQVRPHRV